MAMYRVVYAKDEKQQDGKVKTIWAEVGMAFDRRDNESITIKMNSIPLTQYWNGALYLFPIEGKSNKAKHREERQQQETTHSYRGPNDPPDDDLPF